MILRVKSEMRQATVIRIPSIYRQYRAVRVIDMFSLSLKDP